MKNLFPKPILKGNKMTNNKLNVKTIERLFEDKYIEDKVKKTYDDHKGACKAIHMFQTMMAISQYHNHP